MVNLNKTLAGTLLAAAAFLGLSSASAPAAVIDVPGQFGQASGVQVEGSPFRLTFRSRSGARLLRSVPRDFLAHGQPYSALGFTLGPEPELAPPSLGAGAGGESNSEAVTRFVVRKIVSVKRKGGSTEVVLSTNDPDGRRLLLSLSPGADRTTVVEARVKPGTGVSAISASFTSGHSASFISGNGEAFHGFGSRREGTDLRGSDIKSWVLDYRFPDASTGNYAPAPGFVSSRGYGVLLDGNRISRWRMASDSPTAWQLSKAGNSMTMRVFTDGVRHAVRSISARTGRHRLPPAWSTGPMLSRTIGILTDRDGVYRQRVEADLARILEGDVPVSSYAFEGWATLPRDFVRSTIRQLGDQGIRSVLYLRSFVSNDIAGTETPGAYEQAIARGLVAENDAGDPYLIPSPFPGGTAAVIDFTNPEARRWWRSRVQDLLDTGADGFMNDFGEQVETDMRFMDGSTGVTMHNRYPVLQAKVTRAAIDAWQRRHPNREPFFFQRAGFSGSPGSAAYENAQFPGDETVDWDRGTGLPSIVPDMLNRAIMGAPGFTTDIGGYAQFSPATPIMPPTGAELFVRWTQAAVFTPFFRVHNSGLNGARMPWDFDPFTLANFKQMTRLHDRARPLTRRLWKNFLKTGIPMTRPLWMVDRAGARGPRGDDQWLLGENLLAAPVMVEGADSRPVRLPPGCWKYLGQGSRLDGNRTIVVAAPLAVLPWFSRCGTRPLGN